MTYRRALIDIGSNTIKAFIYNKKIECVGFYEKHTSLLKHVHNELITQEGIRKAINDIISLMALLNENGCKDIFAYATQAVRACRNSNELLLKIKEATGLDFNILSGADEAYYDYISLKHYSGCKYFAGANIGGGSGQIIISAENNKIFYESYPIGSMKITMLFVKHNQIEENDERDIAEYIHKIIKNIPLYKTDTFYAMGGSAVALSKLIQKTLISIHDIDNLLDNVRSSVITQSYLSEKIPNREQTALTGAVIIKSIAEIFGSKNIKILATGTKEGYILKNSLLQ